MAEIPENLKERLNEIVTKRPKEAVRISTSVNTEDTWRYGQVTDLMDAKDSTLVRVRTDSGAIVAPDREIATENLMGCIGLFVKGEQGNALLHLTPSSRLGYSSPGEKIGPTENTYDYLTDTIKKIMPDLKKLGPLEKLQVVLMANLLSEDRPELHRIKEALQKEGVRWIKAELLPFSNTLIAYLPQDDSDHLIATGNPVYYREGDELLSSKAFEYEEALIPIAADTGQTLTLPEKPVPRKPIIKIRQATHGAFDNFNL